MKSIIRFHLIFLIALGFALTCSAAHPPRKWTNSLGVTMDATLVRVDGNHVSLLLKTGRIITIDIDKLSKADQDYLSDWEKQEAGGGMPSPSATPAPQQSPGPAATPAPEPPSQARPSAPALPPESILPPLPPRRPANLLLRPELWQRGKAPDPSVRPKAELYLTFPELGKSRSGNEPMAMHVRIPDNYRPGRPVPLIVWLSGGDGSSWFHEAAELVDQKEFVMVGINYPGFLPEPRFVSRQGQIGRIWDVQEKMLARLAEMIPNLDPRLRIAAGFSNGAHTIGGCLSQKETGFYGFFNVFVLIEGGYSNTYIYPQLPGRYFYVAWGTGKDGDGNQFGLTVANAAKKAGMNVEAHAMEGVGHDFPASEEQKVRAWIRGVVLPALAPDI